MKSVTLESILKSTSGVDGPEKVKRYIFNSWRREHLGYVLLVGDRDMMPLRYMTSLKFAAGIARMEPDGDWVKPATFAQAVKFNLFGDPSLPMAGAK